MKISGRLFALLLLLWMSGEGIAQHSSPTSLSALKEQLRSTTKDTQRVAILLQISDYYRAEAPREGLAYAQQAYDLSCELGYVQGRGRALYHLGIHEFLQGKYQTALNHLNQAQKVYENTQDLQGKSEVYTALGSTYHSLGDYGKAVEYYFQALRLAEQLAKPYHILSALGNIGLLYWNEGKSDQALTYLIRSLKIAQDNQIDTAIPTLLNSTALAYIQKEEWASAQKYLLQAKNILEQQPELNINLMASVLSNLGTTYRYEGTYDDAIMCLHKALEIKKKLGSLGQTASIHRELGKTHMQLERYDSAKYHLEKSIEIAQQIQAKDTRLESYQDLVTLESQQGNFEEAFQWIRKYYDLKDSLYNLKKAEQMEEIRAKYEADQKEKENQLLRRKNELIAAEILNQKLREEQLLMEKMQQQQQNELLRAENMLKQSTIEKQKMKADQAALEKERQEKQNEILRQKQALKDQQITQQKYIQAFLVVVLLLLVALLFIILRGRKMTKRAYQVQSAQKEEISRTNKQLYQTLEELKSMQNQLIQSEKLASLGQLTAGVAHEINTPIGAIKASIGNISNSVEKSIETLPLIWQKLSPQEQDLFVQTMQQISQTSPVQSLREQRKSRIALTKTLESADMPHASHLAEILVELDIHSEWPNYQSLLRHPQALLIFETLYHLKAQQVNSQNIQEALQKVSKIVYALKSYSHTQSYASTTLCDIRETVESVIHLYSNQIKHDIDLQQDFQEIPKIYAYPDELSQVWTNLLQNAVHAMPHGGIIRIRVFQEDKYILTEIQDSGQGIPHEIQDRIFEPFFTSKPRGEGTGLGLDITRKIVEKHQGKIDFESLPGQGSTFRVYLPVNTQD